MSQQPPAHRQLEPHQPKRMGRYTLLRPLSSGDSLVWEVWLAHTQSSAGFDRLCVVKRAKPQQAAHGDFVRRLVAEARLLAELQSGSVAQLLDSGVQGGVPFLAFELVEGKDLEQVLAATLERREPLPIPVVLHLGVRLLEGLAALYRRCDGEPRLQGRPFRNVHPSNVMVSFDGEVKLVGLGAPHLARPTCGASIDGYPGTSRAGDLFDVGALLYELATGTRPAEAATDPTGMRVLGAPKALPSPGELNAQCPAGLDSVVSRALGFEPARRYETPEELRAPLLKLLLEIDPSGGIELTAKHMRAAFATEYRAGRAALEQARVELDEARNPFEAERAVTRPYGPLPRHLITDPLTSAGTQSTAPASDEADVTQPTPRELLARPVALLGEDPPSAALVDNPLQPFPAVAPQDGGPASSRVQRRPPERADEPEPPPALSAHVEGDDALLEPTPSDLLLASEPPLEHTPSMPHEVLEPSHEGADLLERPAEAPAAVQAGTKPSSHEGLESRRRLPTAGSLRRDDEGDSKALLRQSRARLPRASQRPTQASAEPSRSALPKVPARSRPTRGEHESQPPRAGASRPELAKGQGRAGGLSKAELELVATAEDGDPALDREGKSPPAPAPRGASPKGSAGASGARESLDESPEDTHASAPPQRSRLGAVVPWLTLPLLVVLAAGAYMAWLNFSEHLREQQIASEPAPDESAPGASSDRPPSAGGPSRKPGARPPTRASSPPTDDAQVEAGTREGQRGATDAGGRAAAASPGRAGADGTSAGAASEGARASATTPAPAAATEPTTTPTPAPPSTAGTGSAGSSAASAVANGGAAAGSVRPPAAATPRARPPGGAATTRRTSPGATRPARAPGGSEAAAAAAEAEFEAGGDDTETDESLHEDDTTSPPAKAGAPAPTGVRGRAGPAPAHEDGDPGDEHDATTPSGDGPPSPGRVAFQQMRADFERLSDDAMKARYRLRVNLLADKLALSGYEPAFLRSVQSLHDAIRNELASQPR